MNTPAHVIFSLALLGQQKAARYALVIVIGALLPDALMFVFYGYEKIRGVPEDIIWNEHYHTPFWQSVFDLFNSIPIIFTALLVSWYSKSIKLSLLFASMLIHCLLDFPVHHDDSHRHFFPLSDFRFLSPISYWDPKHYGNIVGLLEFVLFIAGSLFLWRAKQQKKWKDISILRIVIASTSVCYFVFCIFVFMTWA